MPEKKTIEQLEKELEGLRCEQTEKESQKREIDLANEIAGKLEPLGFYGKIYVLRIVTAMINNTVTLDVSLEVKRRD